MTGSKKKSGTIYHTVPLSREDVPGKGCCVVETSYTSMFPSYLEKYMTGAWSSIQNVLKTHELKGDLNLLEGTISVKTTSRTWDPLAILKGRDFMKLLARSVPLAQAQKVFDDDLTYDIVPIGGMVRNVARFVKRRQRLIGPNGQTLRTLEILTDCFIHVQGKTVAIVGPENGVKQAKQIVHDCMRNIHPVYGLKRLLVLRELQSREDMKNEDWSSYLPSYHKRHLKRKRRDSHEKKDDDVGKSILPNQNFLRKEDIAMQSGEAFFNAPKRRRIDKTNPSTKGKSKDLHDEE